MLVFNCDTSKTDKLERLEDLFLNMCHSSEECYVHNKDNGLRKC